MSQKGPIIESSILPSFPRIRQQNLNVLYGDSNINHDNHSTAVDKSRMGHVDSHIQNLVDFINQNPKFVTLSSCSGRIVLFHPTATIATEKQTSTTGKSDDNKVDEGLGTNTNPIESSISGKGTTGSWIFVSHDVVEDPMANIVPYFFPIDTSDMEITEQYQENQLCYFRFEPMLLHVAACNLDAGQFLLQVALQNGLRESGMILTSQRVTVAFRTHSLALSIPLSFQKDHIFFPKSAEYIVALTNELNRRLLLNLQLIQKVFTSLQQAFVSTTSPSTGMPMLYVSNDATIPHQTSSDKEPFAKEEVTVSWEQQSHAVPELNLYGHVAIALVVITKLTEYEDVEVREMVVFGGYGIGPTLVESPVSQPSKRRSASIYRLRQEQESWGKSRLQWNSHWENVDVTNTTAAPIVENTNSISTMQIFFFVADDDEHTFYTGTLEVKPMEWDGRLFAAAVDLSKILYDVNNCINSSVTTTHILLFGGRYGPNKPMNDLIIFEYVNHGTTTIGGMFTPQDVRGTIPTPRWGHTFTALNHPRRNIQLPFDPTIIIPVAVLIGGRQTHGNCIDALYVLSIVPSFNSSTIDSSCSVNNHFLWERISTVNDSLYHNLSRCFHTATTINDMNHLFVFGGLMRPEYFSESFDDNSIHAENETVPSLLLALTPHKSNAVSETNESFRVDVDQLQIPIASSRFAHSAINLTSSHERQHIKLGLQSTQRGIILLAGGVSQKISPNSSDKDRSFMDCLHYVFVNGNVVFDGNLVDLTCNGAIESNSEAMDHGPMIHHCCMSFPKIDQQKKSSFSEHDVLFIGGGVSGFAFQEFFASSQHFSFQWSYRYMDCGNCDDETRTTSSIEPTGRSFQNSIQAKITKPTLSASICDEMPLCNVVYVLKQNAKVVKIYLEDSKCINKLYRMTAVEAKGITRWLQTEPVPNGIDDFIKDYIAIPIHAQFIGSVQRTMEESGNTNTMSLIVGYGQQTCLPSTGSYARGNGVAVP